MNAPVNLIREERRLFWIRFSSLRAIDGNVAVVCRDRVGTLHHLKPKPPRVRPLAGAEPSAGAKSPFRAGPPGAGPATAPKHAFPFRMRYEVDKSDHRETFELSLPAKDGVHTFDVTAVVGFRAGDPVEIVERDFGDALALIGDHLYRTLRPIARDFDIEDSLAAEKKVNDRLTGAALRGSAQKGGTASVSGVTTSTEEATPTGESTPTVGLTPTAGAPSSGGSTTGTGTAPTTGGGTRAGAEQREATMTEAKEEETATPTATTTPSDPMTPTTTPSEPTTPSATTTPTPEATQTGVTTQTGEVPRSSEVGCIWGFDKAITVYSCWATVRPDAAYRAHVTAMESAERERVLKEREGRVDVIKAEQATQVESIRESAKIDRHVRMVHALGSRHLNPRQLIGFYLQQNPSDGEKALKLLLEYEEAQTSQLESRHERWIELFRFMVTRKLIEPNDPDAARFKNDVMGWIVASPAPVSSGLVLPIYLVVDESGAVDLSLVANGIRELRAGLQAEPETASPLALSVLGFTDSVQERQPPTIVNRSYRTPQFSERRGIVGYRALFADLRERLPLDVGRLWSQGSAVHRPVVFLLTASLPNEADDWRTEHDRLVDRHDTWYAPHIVVYGVVARTTERPGADNPADDVSGAEAPRADAREVDGQAADPPLAEVRDPIAWKAFVARLATQSDFAMVSEADHHAAIANVFVALRQSLVSSGRALAENRIRLVVGSPADFHIAAVS
jgi:uncharacterized protein YegL